MFHVFFFNQQATTESYTLSLHDALPICRDAGAARHQRGAHDLVEAAALHLPGQRRVKDAPPDLPYSRAHQRRWQARSEEHTSELQSRRDLVCRLLLDKKKPQMTIRLRRW